MTHNPSQSVFSCCVSCRRKSCPSDPVVFMTVVLSSTVLSTSFSPAITTTLPAECASAQLTAMFLVTRYLRCLYLSMVAWNTSEGTVGLSASRDISRSTISLWLRMSRCTERNFSRVARFSLRSFRGVGTFFQFTQHQPHNRMPSPQPSQQREGNCENVTLVTMQPSSFSPAMRLMISLASDNRALYLVVSCVTALLMRVSAHVSSSIWAFMLRRLRQPVRSFLVLVLILCPPHYANLQKALSVAQRLTGNVIKVRPLQQASLQVHLCRRQLLHQSVPVVLDLLQLSVDHVPAIRACVPQHFLPTVHCLVHQVLAFFPLAQQLLFMQNESVYRDMRVTLEEPLKVLSQGSYLIADAFLALGGGTGHHHLPGVGQVLHQQLSLGLLVEQGLQGCHRALYGQLVAQWPLLHGGYLLPCSVQPTCHVVVCLLVQPVVLVLVLPLRHQTLACRTLISIILEARALHSSCSLPSVWLMASCPAGAVLASTAMLKQQYCVYDWPKDASSACLASLSFKCVGTDPSKRNLFRANVRDVPEIKCNFESDYITVEMVAEQLTGFNKDTHAAHMLN
ncbi:hypothetical protein PR048_001102 [Dryococelus australis]|uniref:Uncharacterized protein n=1 Tax=Dryococelus australis TaxID=614101 RepID=A0ABQ9IHR7_9NEOP|nr:hypothetical protein PR048_001102 [Dryococelus australis]